MVTEEGHVGEGHILPCDISKSCKNVELEQVYIGDCSIGRYYLLDLIISL